MPKINTIERGICSSKNFCCAKLDVTDWMKGMPSAVETDLAEVRFKNTRKDYFRNVNHLHIKVGDLVAVEGSPGHDIGIISLTGDLVHGQMRRRQTTTDNGDFRKIYRHARPHDIEKWKQAIAMEHGTMIRSRKIVKELGLEMKIGDVEYQGDKSKAIFYYIADGRVDFRQLIRVLADNFHIRIEMKQIGARQEAGRIGGIGPCGRELCCSAWMAGFTSVTTASARYQELSMNPQKLAGQCGKLKCCLNFELDTYLDAQKNYPSGDLPLETESGTYIYFKSDILKGIFWYVQKGDSPTGLKAVPVKRVKEIQQMNKKGQKPEKLMPEPSDTTEDKLDTFQNIVGQEALTRFDQPKKKRYKGRNTRRRQPGR